MSLETIARRYATALADVAIERGEAQAVQKVTPRGADNSPLNRTASGQIAVQHGPASRRNARTEHKSADAADIAAVQGHLEEFLGLPVRINADADPRSGAVTIRYRTLDQLDLICQRLTGGGV